jgi:uncharacterized protein YjiS (DUF1127 family)
MKHPNYETTMTIKTFMRSISAFVAASATNAVKYIGGGGRTSKLRRWWLDRDKSRRALAALDDDQLSNLSDIGRQIRREARQARNSS